MNQKFDHRDIAAAIDAVSSRQPAHPPPRLWALFPNPQLAPTTEVKLCPAHVVMGSLKRGAMLGVAGRLLVEAEERLIKERSDLWKAARSEAEGRGIHPDWVEAAMIHAMQTEAEVEDVRRVYEEELKRLQQVKAETGIRHVSAGYEPAEVQTGP